MHKKELSKMEAAALAEAGDTAGQFLEELEKFSLADLTVEEYHEFLEVFLNAFGDRMRHRTLNYVGPY